LKIGFPVMLKSQIMRGKRGKGGLIKEAGCLRDVINESTEMLGKRIDNEIVRDLLVEEKIDIEAEFFIAITCDDVEGCPVIVCSAGGGVDVEEMSRDNPEGIVKYHVNPLSEFYRFNAIDIARKLGLKGPAMISAAGAITGLYRLFREIDATLIEINPLAITKDKKVSAVDAKITIDEAAVERHPDFMQYMHKEEYADPLEERASKNGITFINLDGSIAVISGGAGITMTLLDMITHFGGKAANFLDMMGGSGHEVFSEAADIVITKANTDDRVKAIFININLTATSLEGAVTGFKRVFGRNKPRVPAFAFVQAADAAVTGMSLEEGRRQMQSIGVKIFGELDEAIKAAVSWARG